MVEDGGVGFDRQHILLVFLPRGEQDVFLAQHLVGVNQVLVLGLLQHESVVPELNYVEHLGLDAHPVVDVGAQFLYDGELATLLR